MCAIFVFSLLLGLVSISKCDLELSIFKNMDEIDSPVIYGVEEKVGSNFSLSCELKTAETENVIYDDQLSWGKSSRDFRFKNEQDLLTIANKNSKVLFGFLKQSDVNKATKAFSPLKVEDGGTYFCTSLKYMLFKVVYVIVRSELKTNMIHRKARKQAFFDTPLPENLYCSDKMFKCMSNGACINQHYVCDGKRDCRDGSDESWEKCRGDACKDKLFCDDGRCIPQSWCCDKHHDLGCTVTFRPSCCQVLSDTYDEYAYVPYNITQIKTNGTRYLFVSLCILATFFSVLLMLLILSKLFIFAKKANCTHQRNLLQLQELPLRQGRIVPTTFRNPASHDYRARPMAAQRYSNESNTSTTHGVLDPLLLTTENTRRPPRTFSDQPPSYSEVISTTPSLCEPPPPYTSTEFLNVREESTVQPV